MALGPGDVQPVTAATLSKFAASASTDMLTVPLEFTRSGTLRVMVKVSTSTTFSLKVINGTDSDVSTLNDDADLTANSWYAADLVVQSGDKYNFQVGAACTVWLRANKHLI